MAGQNQEQLRIALAVALGVFWVFVFFAARDAAWVGSTQLHTVMEVIATLLALMVGILGLIRYAAKRDNTILLIGAAFLGTAFLDGYHALVTSEWFDELWPSPPPHLVPWSWNASRTFLGFMLVLSWVGWQREQRLGRLGAIEPRAVLSVVAVLSLASFTFFALAPLPRAYYPELPIGRPEELVSALLFAVALVAYLRKGSWRHDSFEYWLVLSLVTGIVCQALVMPMSFELFDGMFDLAHMLKKASYIFVLAGLLISLSRVLVQAEKDRRAVRLQTEQLERLSSLDGLTGIANRRSFDRVIDMEWKRASRRQEPIALLMVDVDNFKDYNDTYGHQAGDDCLRLVARALAGSAQRPGDLVARYGGEEFAVLLPNCSQSDAMALAENLRKRVAALPPPDSIAANSRHVTVSVGIADSAWVWASHLDTAPAQRRGAGKSLRAPGAEALVEGADRALYYAKRSGRNRIAAITDVPARSSFAGVDPVAANQES